MKIVYDLNNMDSNSVFPFYVCLSGGSFPDKTWTDFGVSIISDWLSLISDNNSQETNEIYLYFMEGAYYLKCKKEECHTHVYGMHLDREIVYFEECMDFLDFKKEIIRVANEIYDQVSEIFEFPSNELLCLAKNISRASN